MSIKISSFLSSNILRPVFLISASSISWNHSLIIQKIISWPCNRTPEQYHYSVLYLRSASAGRMSSSSSWMNCLYDINPSLKNIIQYVTFLSENKIAPSFHWIKWGDKQSNFSKCEFAIWKTRGSKTDLKSKLNKRKLKQHPPIFILFHYKTIEKRAPRFHYW